MVLYIYWIIHLLCLVLSESAPLHYKRRRSLFFLFIFFLYCFSAMASSGVVGFVGLDDLSLELAASLIRSGYAVKAFEVYFDYFSLVSIFFSWF